MYWIITHYWISAMVAIALVGGIWLLLDSLGMSRKKTYPTPKRRVLLKDWSPKKSGSPLLIRLPKLG